MTVKVSERSFEDAIECALLQDGPDAWPGDATALRETPDAFGESPPGGYYKRRPEDYDRALCLLSRDVVDFVLATQTLPERHPDLHRRAEEPLSGEDVEDAIRQYKTDRDPRDLLLTYGHCLAHFTVDPDLVYVTTALAGAGTQFLPFNQGKFGGAGNPPVPPTRTGYATAYLWEETWARDSVLDLVRQFIHGGGGRGREGAEDRHALSDLPPLPAARRRPPPGRERPRARRRTTLSHSALGGQREVRSGPGTVPLAPEGAAEYIRTRFPAIERPRT